MEAHTRFREPLLGWIPMFEYTMLALKCLFGPYTRDLGVAVEKFGDFTYPIAHLRGMFPTNLSSDSIFSQAHRQTQKNTFVDTSYPTEFKIIDFCLYIKSKF